MPGDELGCSLWRCLAPSPGPGGPFPSGKLASGFVCQRSRRVRCGGHGWGAIPCMALESFWKPSGNKLFGLQNVLLISQMVSRLV